MKPSTIKYSAIILTITMLVVLFLAIQDLPLHGIAICTGMVCIGLAMCIDILVPRGEYHAEAMAGMEEQAYWDQYANDIEEQRLLANATRWDDSAHLAVDYSWMDDMTIDEADEVFKDIIGH